jgi:sigma-B regulation protein RsbU (phosphoserine phosphatase)
VLYTDGVVEAENERREDYGDTRLRDLVRDSANATSAEIVDRILTSVGAFLGTSPQNDDITCFVVRYRGARR